MKFIHFLLMFLGELALETLNIDITKKHFYSPHNTLFSIKQNQKGKRQMTAYSARHRFTTFIYQLKRYNVAKYKEKHSTLIIYPDYIQEYASYHQINNNNFIMKSIRCLRLGYHGKYIPLLTIFLLLSLVLSSIWLFPLYKSYKLKNIRKKKEKEIYQMNINILYEQLHNQLTLIISPLQELMRHIYGDWEYKQLLHIQDSANKLSYIISQTKILSDINLGLLKLNIIHSNAYKRVLDCFMSYKYLSRKKHIEYNFYTKLQDEDLFFDENVLILITNKLLANAFKYTESGKSITIRLYKEDKNLVLQVSDTGIGIPVEKQQKIFDRFYQIENSYIENGLGLSMVQQLVELHHGKIILQSEIRKGSTFSIRFPQDKSSYNKDEFLNDNMEEKQDIIPSIYSNKICMKDEHEPTNTQVIKTKNGTILIAESNEELRQYISNNLSSLFYLLEAKNGKEALDILKRQEVNLIITNAIMPVIDGIKLCKLVKENLSTRHIPVYILSTKTDIESQLESFRVGADDYIIKPFSINILKFKTLNMLHTSHYIFEHSSNIMPTERINTTMNKEILEKANMVVEKNIDNMKFSIKQFAWEMNMSCSSLHMKLKAITGESTTEFIHKIRLNRACQLLEEGKFSISEISFMVGYNTPSYFTTCFKKYVGCLPIEYKNRFFPV